MLQISQRVAIPMSEIEFAFVRSQGPGGQNVNKSATAAHLRFNIAASSLPDFYKTRLLRLKDRRVTEDGVIVIKAQSSRSQDANREDALERLRTLIRQAASTPKTRRPSKRPAAVNRRRLEDKSRRGDLKKSRRPVRLDE